MVKRISVKEDLDRDGIDEFKDIQGLTKVDVCNHGAVKSGGLMDAVSVNDVYQADSVDGVTIRRSKLTKKGREYQQKMLFDKRKNLHARMTRKSKLIDDLVYSSKNLTTVREEMHQYDDQFKMLDVNHAQGLLRQRYGDPHIVLASYRKEVRNLPKLTFGDAKGFRLFFNFLLKCDGVAKEQN